MQTFNVTWTASLSNGEVFYEGKKPFDYIDGERMPFARLQTYIADNKLEITSLSLFHEKENTFIHVPSKAKNPRFHAFSTASLPFDYDVVRKAAKDVGEVDNGQLTERKHGEIDMFTVAICYYDGFQLEVWVDDNNPKNAYTLITKR